MVEIGSWTQDLCLGDPMSLPLHHEVPVFWIISCNSRTRKLWTFLKCLVLKFLWMNWWPGKSKKNTRPIYPRSFYFYSVYIKFLSNFEVLKSLSFGII
jgi:hypothetical protein